MMIPAQHIIRIRSDRPTRVVAGMLHGDSTPDFEGGRGGYDATKRIGRTPFVEWTGPEVRSYPLAILLHETARSGDVTEAMRRLERMCEMPAEGVAPSIVRVEGFVPAAGRRWVIDSLEFSETVKDDAGRYEKCVATMTLLEAEQMGDGVVVANRAPSTYKVRKGDTLTKISQRFYGNPKFAGPLGRAQAKPIKDIRAVARTTNRKLPMHIGRVLVIP